MVYLYVCAKGAALRCRIRVAAWQLKADASQPHALFMKRKLRLTDLIFIGVTGQRSCGLVKTDVLCHPNTVDGQHGFAGQIGGVSSFPNSQPVLSRGIVKI